MNLVTHQNLLEEIQADLTAKGLECVSTSDDVSCIVEVRVRWGRVQLRQQECFPFSGLLLDQIIEKKAAAYVRCAKVAMRMWRNWRQ